MDELLALDTLALAAGLMGIGGLWWWARRRQRWVVEHRGDALVLTPSYRGLVRDVGTIGAVLAMILVWLAERLPGPALWLIVPLTAAVAGEIARLALRRYRGGVLVFDEARDELHRGGRVAGALSAIQRVDAGGSGKDRRRLRLAYLAREGLAQTQVMREVTLDGDPAQLAALAVEIEALLARRRWLARGHDEAEPAGPARQANRWRRSPFRHRA